MDYTREQLDRWYQDDIERMRRLTSEQRLTMSLQLFEMSRNLMRDRLREEFPKATDDQLQSLLHDRIRAMRDQERAA